MTKNPLLIIFDRGTLKAFGAEATPTRREPALRLIQSFELTDAHGRYQDKFTDQAGRFPAGPAGGGRHQNAHAERQGLELENDRRIFKQLVDQITRVVNDVQPEGWVVAAPSEINSAVIDQLPAVIRDRLMENVAADLTRIEQADLARRFKTLATVE